MLDRTIPYGGGAKCIRQTDRHVAARIRAARLEAGLSQTALAGDLGVTFQQLQKYEKAVNRIGPDRLQKIANKVGKPVSWFFGDAPTNGAAAQDNTVATVVQLMGSNASIREIVVRLALLDRDDARIVADLVKRLTHS